MTDHDPIAAIDEALQAGEPADEVSSLFDAMLTRTFGYFAIMDEVVSYLVKDKTILPAHPHLMVMLLRAMLERKQIEVLISEGKPDAARWTPPKDET